MALSRRRQDEQRTKARTRKIAKRWAPEVWRAPRLGPKTKTEWIEHTAVRLAHHNKCPCSLCKRERYDRTAANRPAEWEG